ncbi:hypothetical protein ALC152_11900 [Arcobacter sp. 15-2]|uniref:putative metalloprotease CJM1_0395 family protein n=1 Tax=Arcobacter sp. 15-2 TaxID=3374109 RepID=UPI00399CD5A9
MDIITEQFENISLHQLYTKLSTKHAEIEKLEEKDKIESIKKQDYIEASINKYDDDDFARVLEKFKNKDAEIRTHEQVHASIGHTTVPISYSYQQGPDGKMYAVGGSVRLETSMPDDPKAAAFKLDMLQKAASAPSNTSGADNAIASQSNLNKILLQLKGEENANK